MERQEVHRIYEYRVRELDGDWVYLETEHTELSGWVRSTDIITAQGGVQYFANRLIADPHNLFVLLMKSRCHRHRGEIAKALDDVNTAARLFPADSAPYSHRASLRILCKDYVNALVDLDRALALEFDSHNLSKRAQLLITLNRCADAIEDLTEAIRLDPSNMWSYYYRAQAHRKNRDLPKALADLDSAIRINSDSVSAFNLRGVCLNASRQYAKAVLDFGEALKRKPGFAIAYSNRGLSWAGLGDVEKALHDFDMAISLSPSYAQAYVNRSRVWHFKECYDRAIADADEAIRIDPRSAEAYYVRGQAGYYSGKYESAIRDYESAIRLDPKQASALSSLAWVLATCPIDQVRDGKAAVENAQQACELSGWGDHRFLLCLAAAYAETRDFESAALWLRAAKERLGNTSPPDAELYSLVQKDLVARRPHRE